MTTTDETSLRWWLRGNYAPIDDERTDDDLEVEGTLPEALRGRYLRNGFNPPGRQQDHWFFGAGMVHGLDLADGRASYRNRYVRTPYLDEDMDVLQATGDLRWSPANTNLISHDGRLLALEEAHLPWELDDALDTVGSYDFGGRLATPMSAHPKRCPVTGELLFFGYQFLTEPWLTYHRVDPAGELVQSEVVELPAPVMMHDFSITERFAVFLDLPIVFRLERGGFRFEREHGARIGLLPRTGHGGDVRWFEIEPCAVFHVLNSYESGDEVVVQVCRIPSLMEGGMNDMGAQGVLWQWTVDTVSGAVKEEPLDDRPCDFPRVDDRRVGLPTGHGYAASLGRSDTPGFGSEVYRYDLTGGGCEVHDLGGPGVHTFEPVFAPAGPDAGDDEGWVLVLGHDDHRDRTTLHVIDVQRFEDEPVARVHLPRRIPFGAHGNWVPTG